MRNSAFFLLVSAASLFSDPGINIEIDIFVPEVENGLPGIAKSEDDINIVRITR